MVHIESLELVHFLKIFLNVDHLKTLYWICYNTASVLCFGVLAMKHVGT